MILTWVTWKSISLSLYWFRSQGTWPRAYSRRSSRWSSRLTEGPWALMMDKVCRGSKEIALIVLHYAFCTFLRTPGDLDLLPQNFLTAFNQDIFLKNFKKMFRLRALYEAVIFLFVFISIPVSTLILISIPDPLIYLTSL